MPVKKHDEGASTAEHDASPCSGEHTVGDLSAAHRRQLVRDSSIDLGVVRERGYKTIQWADREHLTRLGIRCSSTAHFPGLLLPIYRATGELISAQFKPASPVTIRGRPVKYLSPAGVNSHLDCHPRNRDRLRDTAVPLWITEGIKKGDSLASRGCCIVTLSGVFNWRSKHGTLGDWEDVPLKGRDVTV